MFQKAITQSGGGLRKYGQGSAAVPLEEALENGKRFFEKLGVSTLEEARAIDAETLRDQAIAFGGIRTWAPTVDGKFLLADPSDCFYRNDYHDVPILLGNCGNEHERGALKKPENLSDVEAYAKANLGKYAEDFIRAANVSTDEQAAQFGSSDAVFIGRCVNNLLFLERQKEFGRKNVYCYYFNPSYPGWDNPGAFHSSDLWFVFETLAKCWRPFVGKHYDLARQMCNYWANFIRSGDPNGLDADGKPMPEWKPYTVDAPCRMVFGDTAYTESKGPGPLMAFLLRQAQKKEGK
jgi:para-nitrobenzyl esterase